MTQIPPTISGLLDAYRTGELTPSMVATEISDRISARGPRPVWISVFSADELAARAEWLQQNASPETHPLYGVPFAVKDNIDVRGLPTTAACPSFAYQPAAHAAVVQRLVDAGAIAVGKTNMDQFATGLVGTRSPYGACGCPFDENCISGGSSSGSAVAVATGLAAFALGTDTAGSGRVPAAFCNLIGLKPTRGVLSTRGVVPACRTLDCVSILALTVDDAAMVLRTCAAYDELDPFSRAEPPKQAAAFSLNGFRFGIPETAQREFFGDEDAAALYERAVETLQDLGGIPVRIDYQPFRDTAELLYSGPWVAERRAAVGSAVEAAGDDADPTVRSIISGAGRFSAEDAFRAMYRLAELKRAADAQMEKVDVLALPTVGTIYTREAVNRDGVRLNSNLGYYTNFVNLLDLAAVAVPAGLRASGIPFGISLIGPAFSERAMLPLADRFHRSAGVGTGALGVPLEKSRPYKPVAEEWSGQVRLAVVGAHLSGGPLNHQLVNRGATLSSSTRTAPMYRLYALPGTAPPKPGLIRDEAGRGGRIAVEVWSMPAEGFGAFVSEVPPPLTIGTALLETGESVKCFLCESFAIENAEEITNHGGWREYVASRTPEPSLAPVA